MISSLESPITFFVFDLDGTLVDSRRDIADSANAVLAECGCAPHSEDAIGRMVGDGAAVLMARAFEAAGCPAPPDALERFLRAYNARLLRHTRPYDGIPDLLEALMDRGPLAVLTNKPTEATHAVLDGLGLRRYFGDRVLGGDGLLPRKPDPAGLMELLARTATAPAAAMMVGDSIVDLRTARNAGVRSCLARYGFGCHISENEGALRPDMVIDRPLALLGSL